MYLWNHKVSRLEQVEQVFLPGAKYRNTVEYVPPGPDKILRLYLDRAHLSIFGALPDVLHQLLLLILQFHASRELHVQQYVLSGTAAQT